MRNLLIKNLCLPKKTNAFSDSKKLNLVVLTGLFFVFFSPNLVAQKLAYQFFTGKGKKVDYEKLFSEFEKADVLFFGELHNNAIAHWLQTELVRDAFAQNFKLVVGAEMFETDTQRWIDDYYSGKIDERTFRDSSRVWPNYGTDYRPALEYARAAGIPYIATNVPRRYAKKVYNEGPESLQSLPQEDKKWLPPLPYTINFELPQYKSMLMSAHSLPRTPETFVAAQAIKDATMAHFILKHLKPGEKFLHFNGTYHSDYKEGIVWYLQKSNPNLKIVTIATASQAKLDALEKENLNRADFILVVPETMTDTYDSSMEPPAVKK